jgi:hypothetical protein
MVAEIVSRFLNLRKFTSKFDESSTGARKRPAMGMAGRYLFEEQISSSG